MKKLKKWADCDGDSTVEFVYARGDSEAFLSVSRNGEHPDEDRVAILSPEGALHLAHALIDYARRRAAASEEKAREMERAIKGAIETIERVRNDDFTDATLAIELGYLRGALVQPAATVEEAEQIIRDAGIDPAEFLKRAKEHVEQIRAKASPSASPDPFKSVAPGDVAALPRPSEAAIQGAIERGREARAKVQSARSPSAGPTLPKQKWPRVYLDPAKWMEIANCKHCPHPERCAESNACTCNTACAHGPSPAPRVGAESEGPEDTWPSWEPEVPNFSDGDEASDE